MHWTYHLLCIHFTDPTELKIGLVLTFANDIPLSDYENVRQTMKVTVR